MGGVVRDVPTPLGWDELRLRSALIVEEVAELLCALAGRDDLAPDLKAHLATTLADLRAVAVPGVADMGNVAKELADVEYVLHGTAHYCGVDLDLAVEVVHESNMAKAHGPRREDGKRLKPEGWQPPDMSRVVGPAPGDVMEARAEGLAA